MGLFLPPFVPFLYSLLVVSCLSSKFLHLAQHVHSVSLADFILYLPTLFFLDVVVICLGRMLLRGPDSLLQWLCCAFGAFIALVTYAASASQFGFSWETGSQIEWGASSSFLRDPAAMKILFSGMRSVALSGAILFAISYITTPYLHAIAGNMLSVARGLFPITRCNADNNNGYTLPTSEPVSRKSSSSSSSGCSSSRMRIALIIVIVALLFLRIRRPSVPYDHLASTLPFTLSAAFHGQPPPHCSPEASRPAFPFPELVESEKWEHPSGDYPGWAPYRDWPSSWPKWLPENPPAGFSRWTNQFKKREQHEEGGNDDQHCEKHTVSYNAATDPAKISNLDTPLYDQLREAFDNSSVRIENIVLLTLESARKETFPMKEGTELYDIMLDTFSEEKRAEAIDKISMMTPTAQMVTGEFAMNSTGQPNTFDDWSWQDRIAPGMGGINVKGALTGSSLTLKSLLGSHCGVMPLPVDLLEEANLDIYQPCIPHILNLFNSKKIDDNHDDQRSFKQRMWNSVFIQTSTDSYDRQAKMNRQIGFNQSITKGTLDDPHSKHYPPQSEEINYFGYAEEELEPYIKDLIFSAAENKTRLFLSHLTVTTHHPWKLPKGFTKQDYFGKDRTTHKDLNSFLNTVRYVDQWVGKILGYLEEAKIADKTLVVIVGDHGQAFEEDDWLQGTYENSHISNFRVPLVFRHPHLPRIDVEANATSLSILPTVLDLLVHSKSLDQEDNSIAESLIHEYQGQSLLRPYKNEYKGRHAWNMGLINAGGGILSVTSAGQPYRLVVPIQNGTGTGFGGGKFRINNNEKAFEYRFTHTDRDPAEKAPVESWTWDGLQKAVGKTYGAEAAQWTETAAKMARWWIDEQKRIWNYRY